MSKRLQILENSLIKKQAAFDAAIKVHFDTVRQANGQPLNDKRNGQATLKKWARQDESLRNQQAEIEKTKRAIEREKILIGNADDVEIPQFLRDALGEGKITQWRKHPNRFFVVGVERGRIIWDEKNQTLAYSYVSEVPREQYPIFRDVFNDLRKKLLESQQ